MNRILTLKKNLLSQIKLIVLICLFIGSPLLTVNAFQKASITVSGIVKDETGSSMPGVNVVLKGTDLGTTTDADGKYKIIVPNESSIIVFSSIAFTSEQVTVGNRTSIDVSMLPDIAALSEVVVV